LTVPVLVFACGSLGGAGLSGSDTWEDGGGADGTTFDGSGSSSGGIGSEAGAGDAGPPPPTTALILHTSPNLPDVRVCWSVGDGGVTSDLPFPSTGEMPATNYPGIPTGGAVALADADFLLGDNLTLYLIDDWNLQHNLQKGGVACDKLICPDQTNCLRPGRDFWQTPAIPQGLQAASSNVVAIGGCVPWDRDASTDLCGPGYTTMDPNGNLQAELLLLNKAAPQTGQLAVQAAQLSPGVASILGDAAAGRASVTFGPEDAGEASVVTALASEGIASQVQYVDVSPDLSTYGTLGFAIDIPVADASPTHFWMSLAQSQQIVAPTEEPRTFFGQPRPYLVAVVGDPSAPSTWTGGAYDGTGLHLLVLTTPTPMRAPTEAGATEAGAVEAGATEAGATDSGGQ
jgi:hypothetical protein